jgi:hypothetical protein
LNIRFAERFKGIAFDLAPTTDSGFACILQLVITVLGWNYDPEEHGLAHAEKVTETEANKALDRYGD